MLAAFLNETLHTAYTVQQVMDMETERLDQLRISATLIPRVRRYWSIQNAG